MEPKSKSAFLYLHLQEGEAGLNGRDDPGSRIPRIDAKESCRLDAWKEQGICKVKFTFLSQTMGSWSNRVEGTGVVSGAA